MKNSEDKIVINYDDITQYYDLYVNGLNVVASGSLYLTGGNTDLFLSEDPIIVNGVDSGKTGVEYDFDVISEYCLKVSQFQPNGPGELDFIFVSNNKLYQLSEMYNYGYQKILVETEENFIFNNAIIITLQATDITQNSAILNATLVDDLPGSLVTETGFNLGIDPDNLTNTVIAGNSVGDFSFELIDLDSQTTYYFQAYASNGNTVKLGNVLYFNTKADFNDATIVTLPATEIDINSVVLNANLVDNLSGTLVTETGFYWSTDPDNLINIESVGNSTGEFSFELNDLDSQTTYYFQAYATDGDIVKIGEILSFNTKADFNDATIITISATEITSNSVVLNASLADDLPGSLVTETGFNWGIDPDNLTNTVIAGNSVGDFSFELSGLDHQTTYYYQAYATNGDMIKLGSVLYFNTKADFNDATIITISATEITSNSVVLNANLVDDLPGSLVTETGFNWSTDPNNLSNTESVGNSVGDFSLELIDLDPQTTYYYRAYATDGTTTLFGEILSAEILSAETAINALMVGSDGYYAHSSDYGNTWTEEDTGNQNWKGCSLLSDGHALMVGFSGYYAYSSDYGHTWTVKDTGGHDWRNCDLLPDGHALMVSPGSYYAYSSDYGNTWTIMTSWIHVWYGCSLLPDGHAIMVGSDGYYAYSSDYGHTRTDRRVGTNIWHNCSLLSDGRALMVGYSGSYAYSSDYGHTWTLGNLGAYTWVGCSLLPDGHAIMVGSDGSYAYSSDYGHTWTVGMVGTNIWYNCSLLSDGLALMVGFEGYYAYSSDYGNTWTMGDTGNQTWVGCSII